MIRKIVAAALAGAVLQAGGLRAQESDNTGLFLGLHLTPLSLDGVGEEQQFSEQGMGLGFTAGWGFNDRVALYITMDNAFVNYNPDNPAAVDEDYEAMTVDLGARMSMGNEFRRTRPFINAAFSVVMTTEDFEELGGEAVTSGAGLTVGGGLQYFYSHRWAFLVGVQATAGAFTEREGPDQTQLFTRGVPYEHYRVQFGANWHP